MKTSTNNAKILAKAIDVELKKTLQQDLQNYRLAQLKKQENAQAVQQAA